MKKENLLGKRYGSLTVIAEAPSRKRPKRGSTAMWHCICDCGKELDVIAASLKQGRTKSCGCQKKQMISNAVHKHGGINDRLYWVWVGIKARCYNRNHSSFKYYGGRGITMCDEWKSNYESFKCWAIKSGYNPDAQYGKCTMDRINNNGNYEPSNCRWVGMDIQNLNKRPRENVTKITFDKRTMSLAEWAAETGLAAGTIRERLRRGWSVSNALTTPKLCSGRKGQG